MKRLISINIFLLLFITAYAQDSLTTAELLKRGTDDFKAGKYQQALVKFDRVSTRNTVYTDAALYLSARTSIRLGRYNEAQDKINKLKSRFQDSAYIDYSKYLEAEIAFAKGDEEKTYNILFRLWEESEYIKLKALVKEKLILILSPLSRTELLKLRSNAFEKSRKLIDDILANNQEVEKIIVLYDPADSSAEAIIAGMKLCLDLYHKDNNKTTPVLEAVSPGETDIDQYLFIKELTDEQAGAVISLYEGEQALLQAWREAG